MRVDGGPTGNKLKVATHFSLWRRSMRCADLPADLRAAARDEDSSLLVALELSKSAWLIAASAPGSEKISKYRVAAADVVALLALLARLQAQADGIAADRSRSYRSTRPVLMVSGCTACWRQTVSRATWWTPRRSRLTAAAGE
jgi:hypothetical protein